MKNLLILLFFSCSLFNVSLFAQKTSFPENIPLSWFYNSDNTIYAITNYDGVFRSINDGASWSQINKGLPFDTMSNSWIINSLCKAGNLIVANCSQKGVYVLGSNDVWTPLNNGLPTVTDPETGETIYHLRMYLESDGGNLYSHALEYSGLFQYGQLYFFNNSEKKWKLIAENVESFVINDKYIFLYSMENKIMRSENEGVSWETLNTGFSSKSIKREFPIPSYMYRIGNNLFIETDDTSSPKFFSDDNGDSWQKSELGVDDEIQIINSSTIISTIPSGVKISFDSGKSWKTLDLDAEYNSSLCIYGLSKNYLIGHSSDLDSDSSFVWRMPLINMKEYHPE